MDNQSYKVLVDTHCHTYASFHAMCSITEVIQLAKRRGLEAVAITDHHPSIDNLSNEFRVRGPDFAYFSVFCERFLNLDDEIELLKGIELNILDHKPWVTEASQCFFEKLDVRLAGIHLQDHLFRKNSNLAANTEAVLNAIYAGKSALFDIMSHPIVFGVPFDNQAIIKAAKERHIALELNNSIFPDKNQRRLIQHDWKEIRRFFELVAVEGAYISIGSDAHVPNEVGVFNASIDFLNEIDFPASLIINRNINTLKNFLAS